MELELLIILIGIIIIALPILILNEDDDIKVIGFLCTLLGGGIIIGVYVNNAINSLPQAIDVYRDNTELNITYKIVNKDTVSVDSTVVFK